MERRNAPDIILENRHFRLTVGADCRVRSLVCTGTGEECVCPDEDIALFSVTQERPYNNEVKLAYPNRRTTYEGNSLRREGNSLIVGFEIAPYEARIEICEESDYISFRLGGFILTPESYGDYLCMDKPPTAEVRLVQLPLRHRESFGEWLNVCHDSRAAVCVLGTHPLTCIDSERRKSCRILTADVRRDLSLYRPGAALIACAPGCLLDCIASVEEDFDLPRGVMSRRSPSINRSAYWTANIHPGNVDEHIRYARAGGFRHMLIYYSALFRHTPSQGYAGCGNYRECDLCDSFPGGFADLRAMLSKIRAAGITPGLHFLQTHIGIDTRYVTPTADHRLHKIRLFTLARPLAAGEPDGAEGTVYVEENPEGSPLHDHCRMLQFGGEVLSYERFVTEWPYRFEGVRRGEYGTYVTEHPTGQIGGVLDVSEFGSGTSIYLDQNSSLQDEIADDLAKVYACGFSFIYFDGSEGTNAPFGIHVPNAQYRVWKKLSPAPLFTEGAAKAHFGWHFLSGGNAFDVFPPEVFKEKLVEHPAEEAPRMRQDFTRLNFGWWSFVAPGMQNSLTGTQPDMYEFGTSLAAAWDCPVTMMENLAAFRAHPRTADILEIMRRWELARESGFLTGERKQELRDTATEHILLVDEAGNPELRPYEHLKSAAGGDPQVRVFLFDRGGDETWAVLWHATGEGRLLLPLEEGSFTLTGSPGGEAVPAERVPGGCAVPLGDRRYLRTALPREALIRALEKSRLL